LSKWRTAHFFFFSDANGASARHTAPRAFPRDWHAEEQHIEPRVVEPLADGTSRRKDEPLFPVGDFREPGPEVLSLAACHASLKHYDVAHEALQPFGEVLDVIASLRQHDR